MLTDKQIADQRNAGHATHLNDPAQSLSLSFLFLTPHLPPPPPPSLSITHSLLLTHPHTLVQNSVIGYWRGIKPNKWFDLISIVRGFQTSTTRAWTWNILILSQESHREILYDKCTCIRYEKTHSSWFSRGTERGHTFLPRASAAWERAETERGRERENQREIAHWQDGDSTKKTAHLSMLRVHRITAQPVM